jgi:hypothetical protein
MSDSSRCDGYDNHQEHRQNEPATFRTNKVLHRLFDLSVWTESNFRVQYASELSIQSEDFDRRRMTLRQFLSSNLTALVLSGA